MTLLPIRPESFAFTVILGLLAALPSVSIDISIPTFLAVQHDLLAPSNLVAQTITLFMVGFALGQFGAGPLSDHYGRRPVLLVGLSCYALAAAGCANASSLTMLIALRFGQGLAAGSCAVLAFAMIRDLFEGDAARSKRSYVTVVFGLAPMLAPTLGAWLMDVMGWRSIFLVLAGAGFLLLLAIVFGVKESRPAAGQAVSARRLTAAYLHLLDEPRFLVLAAVNAFSFGAMFAYIAGSSMVMMGSMHLTAQVYAAFFACTAASLTAGAFVSGRAAAAGVSPARLVWAGLTLAALTACGMWAILAHWANEVVMLIPLLLVNLFCRGVVAPNAQHMALEPMRENAGTAAAAIGVLQILTGALASALVSWSLGAFGRVGLPGVMAVLACLALLLWVMASARRS